MRTVGQADVVRMPYTLSVYAVPPWQLRPEVLARRGKKNQEETLTPTSLSTRPQQQLTRDLFYKRSAHKEAVRQLHYTAEDVEEENEVEDEDDEGEASPRQLSTKRASSRYIW